MTFVSLSLITMWMALEILGVTLAGFVHVLVLAAVLIVFLSGNRRARRARKSAEAEAAGAGAR